MVPALAFTIAEAAEVLHPHITEKQLRAIIRELGWKPDGVRRTGRSGHPVATFDSARLMQLYAALAPFMELCRNPF
jgi:hypothetical protein